MRKPPRDDPGRFLFADHRNSSFSRRWAHIPSSRWQMAANFIRGKHFFLLTQMYRLQFGI